MQLRVKHLMAAKQLHAAMQQQARVHQPQVLAVVHLLLVLLVMRQFVTVAGCSCSAALMRSSSCHLSSFCS
jgi:hypothetical protein